VSPIDVLILINYINQAGFTLPPAPIPPAKPQYYFDVDGDGAVTPKDVLMVINYLNLQASQQGGEGEAAIQGYAAQLGPEPNPGSRHAKHAPLAAETFMLPQPSLAEGSLEAALTGRDEPVAQDAVFRSLEHRTDSEIDLLLDGLLDELLGS
jgi:hypothetical protein